MECRTGRRELRAARDASDVAVEGLHHSEDELSHTLTPPHIEILMRSPEACFLRDLPERLGVSDGPRRRIVKVEQRVMQLPHALYAVRGRPGKTPEQERFEPIGQRFIRR